MTELQHHVQRERHGRPHPELGGCEDFTQEPGEIGEDYVFPDAAQSPQFAEESIDALSLRLRVLSDSALEYKGGIRNEYCAIHLELNRRASRGSTIAPRFRSVRRPPPRHVVDEYRSDQLNLSNDNQVIDLHWLYTKGHSAPNDRRGERLFAGSDFAFDLAAELVTTLGDTKTKCRQLDLNHDEQWECASIQANPIRERWVEIQKEASKVNRLLRSRARRHHQIREHIATWTSLYVAMQIERAIVGSSAGCNAASVARWYELITGKSMNRQLARRKMGSLRTHLDAMNCG